MQKNLTQTSKTIRCRMRCRGNIPVHSAQVVLLTIATSILIACGGGADTTANVQQPSNTTSINGIAVPPDPGVTGTATVVGVDIDGNGIRDEIDRFVATKYGANPVSLNAARISARALQLILVTDPTSKTSSVVVLQDNGDAGVCAGRGFREAKLTSSKELDEIFVRTVNTQARVTHFKSVAAKAGLLTRSASAVVCP